MVHNHFLIIWDNEDNKAIHSELSKGGEWQGTLLVMCHDIYKLNLQNRLEIIHVGSSDPRQSGQSKTFRKDEIELIGHVISEDDV